MHSKIFGRRRMGLPDLVRAVLAGDLIVARQWVADAYRAGVNWECLDRPDGLDDREMLVAAAMAELLASRRGATPPPWVFTIGSAAEPVVKTQGGGVAPRREASNSAMAAATSISRSSRPSGRSRHSQFTPAR